MGWRGIEARGVGGGISVSGTAGPRTRGIPGRRSRWIAMALLGALWWWAALRLTLWPQSAGVIEGTVVVGGWGLSLLPVHCVPWRARGERRRARPPSWAALTTAWRRRRSGGGSGRS